MIHFYLFIGFRSIYKHKLNLIYDLFMVFLRRPSFGLIDFQWRDNKLLDLTKKTFICVRKMKECLMGLK